MKTKKAMKPYTCYLCKGTVQKGEQYARKSILLGYAGTWGAQQGLQVLRRGDAQLGLQ